MTGRNRRFRTALAHPAAKSGANYSDRRDRRAGGTFDAVAAVIPATACNPAGSPDMHFRCVVWFRGSLSQAKSRSAHTAILRIGSLWRHTAVRESRARAVPAPVRSKAMRLPTVWPLQRWASSPLRLMHDPARPCSLNLLAAHGKIKLLVEPYATRPARTQTPAMTSPPVRLFSSRGEYKKRASAVIKSNNHYLDPGTAQQNAKTIFRAAEQKK